MSISCKIDTSKYYLELILMREGFMMLLLAFLSFFHSMEASLKKCFTATASFLSYHDHGEVWAEISTGEWNELFTYSLLFQLMFYLIE